MIIRLLAVFLVGIILYLGYWWITFKTHHFPEQTPWKRGFLVVLVGYATAQLILHATFYLSSLMMMYLTYLLGYFIVRMMYNHQLKLKGKPEGVSEEDLYFTADGVPIEVVEEEQRNW